MPTVNISPDINVAYTGPTKFLFSFPELCAGFIVLGDMPCPYDVDTSINLPLNADLLVSSSNPTYVTFAETTRVRVYFYVSNGTQYGDRLAEFTEFTIHITDRPLITVDGYGNSASFEESTTAKFRTNMPGTLDCEILNVDRGVKIAITVDITEEKVYDLPITESTTVKVKFTASDKTTEEQFYYFKKEPFSERSIYGTKLIDNELVNNFDEIFYPGMIGCDIGISDGESEPRPE